MAEEIRPTPPLAPTVPQDQDPQKKRRQHPDTEDKTDKPPESEPAKRRPSSGLIDEYV